jgi:hypothetical protein
MSDDAIKNQEQLVQDDFDWSGDKQSSPASSVPHDQATELDRIEFEHIEKEKPEPLPPQETPPVTVEPVPERTDAGIWKLLQRRKMYILSGLAIMVLLICAVVVWHLARTGETEEANLEAGGDPIVTLDSFVVATEKTKAKNFLSYSVTLTIAPEFFDFFETQQPVIRGEIYEILKRIEQGEDIREFYEQVKKRINAKLGLNLILAASATPLRDNLPPVQTPFD